MSTTHRCSKCQQHKIASDFPHAKGVIHSWCRECNRQDKKARRAAWRANNPRKSRISADYTTPDGLLICAHCRKAQNRDAYQAGKISWCRTCRSALAAARRRQSGTKQKPKARVGHGEKSCLRCGEMKALGEFSPSVRGRLGLSSYCRPCARLRVVDPAKARAHTAAYRLRHRAKSLAAHRIHQWQRVNAMKAVKDGTVTSVLLNTLYTTDTCYYCMQFTPESKRTIDHKTPLKRGGVHTSSNLAMACKSCNCSKGAKNEAEFREYMHRKRTKQTILAGVTISTQRSV